MISSNQSEINLQIHKVDLCDKILRNKKLRSQKQIITKVLMIFIQDSNQSKMN